MADALYQYALGADAESHAAGMPVVQGTWIMQISQFYGGMTGAPIAGVKSASVQFLTTWERRDTYIALVPFADAAMHLTPTLAPSQNPCATGAAA